MSQRPNLDIKTVESFGEEWYYYTQKEIEGEEAASLFERYFSIFPWKDLPDNAVGFDMGCGTGRWARLVAPRVGHLTCIDPATQALEVARQNLAGVKNVTFLNNSTSDVDLEAGSQDFGYSLGVLHHVPNTQAALKDCVVLLKPGAPFLLYCYYRFDNRPLWFRALWHFSDFQRHWISRLPNKLKIAIANLIALFIYWPLAHIALVIEKLRFNPHHVPLSAYRHLSFYTMRTDARDRFGTPLEQRFKRTEIAQMMENAGLKEIKFSEAEPYWCAVGVKK